MPPFSSRKANGAHYGFHSGPLRAPQHKDFGHPPAFANSIIAVEGKPEGTQYRMVPCTAA